MSDFKQDLAKVIAFMPRFDALIKKVDSDSGVSDVASELVTVEKRLAEIELLIESSSVNDELSNLTKRIAVLEAGNDGKLKSLENQLDSARRSYGEELGLLTKEIDLLTKELRGFKDGE